VSGLLRAILFSQIATVSLLGLGTTAHALTLTGLQAKGTFENAGVRVSYTDDADSNGTVSVEYRQKGTSQWLQGHPMVRIAGDRFATSLFGLSEGTTYEVQLTTADPGGASVDFTQPFEITTRSSDFPDGGNDIYVDASAGPGGNGTQGSPYATIQEAADAAQPGDVVHILPGTYREQITPARSGTESAWIHYVGEGSGVVLDGAEDIPTGSGWTDEGSGVYSVAYAGTPNYATLDSVRLYQHSSLSNLVNDGDSITGGYYIENGRLYVRPPDGGGVAGRSLRVSVHAYGFYIDGRSCIVIDNLDVGYYDNRNIRIRNSHHITVRSCAIHHSRNMVSIDGITSTDNLVENCTIRGTGVTAWPWEICHHDHDCSSNAISVSNAGEGNVIRRNSCRGVFNGIYLGQWTTDYPDENALENDVYDNHLEEIVDDGLEPECKAINLRMYGNTFKNVFSPISLAPIETGPTWIMRNVIDGLWAGSPGWERWGGSPGWVKISTTPSGDKPMGALRIYHNTAYVDEPAHNGWGSSSGSGYTHFVNNIVRSTRYVFENTSSDPYPPGNRWDYNNFYTTSTDQYVKWENVRLDEAGFQALGFQMNGISAPPSFVDVSSGDFRLQSDDPGIDKGVYLPGINDGFYNDAPDMGAFEYGVSTVMRPPEAVRGSRSPALADIYTLTGQRIAAMKPWDRFSATTMLRRGLHRRPVGVVIVAGHGAPARRIVVIP
jgi:hypothetical protein